MSWITGILPFVPIILLLILSLTWGVKQAVLLAFAVTVGLFFVDGGDGATLVGALVNAAGGTLTILMIVVGAILLYVVMEQTGALGELERSLETVHPDRQVRFFFLALFLAAFFESVAGFGTPGAIVPLLLIGMGFSPALSIAAVLLFNGLFAVSGAVGVPVTAGLAGPLDLDADTVRRVYAVAGIGVAVASVAVMGFVRRQVRTETGELPPRVAWLMLAGIMVTYAVLAPWLRELTGLVAAGGLALGCFVFLFERQRMPWRPWLPYGLLVVLLFLPRVLPSLSELINVELALRNVLGSGIDTTLKPLRSPLVPFIAAAGLALLLAKRWRVDLRPVVSKSTTVLIVLFPSLAITQLMLHSGGDGPSMVDRVAGVVAASGQAFPLLSPLLGTLGTFMTGSTTVSNVIFGPVQQEAAQNLGLETGTVLGVQLAGASLGNAVCLFNIIAAAAVVGTDNYNAILRRTVVPVVVGALLVAVVGYVALAI